MEGFLETIEITDKPNRPAPEKVKRFRDLLWEYGADYGADYVYSQLLEAAIANETRNLSDIGCNLYLELQKLEVKKGVSQNTVASEARKILDHMRDIEDGKMDPE